MTATAGRQQIVSKGCVILDGETIAYTLRRSYRARYARLEVSQKSGLIVVIPGRLSILQVPELLRRKKRWILTKLREWRQARSSRLRTGDMPLYLGRGLRLVERRDHFQVNSVAIEQDRLVVCLSPGCSLAQAIEDWYRQQANNLLPERVALLSARLGVTCRRLSIRRARTRWGSCSAKGNLSLNWRLVMAPEPVIDYVIIHELCHLREMNHSSQFWGLVTRRCPEWREHKAWLKAHQTELNNRLSSERGDERP